VGRNPHYKNQGVQMRKKQVLQSVYRSKILKLELFQNFTENQGLLKDVPPIFIPDNNLNKIIIKVDGVKKNLTRDGLKKYLKRVQKELDNFIEQHKRLVE
jgi:hypothetical protein